jgi:hypothetical protein
MNTFDDIWRKLAKSKKYREEFALAFLKRSVPFQVKTLRKKHCGSQAVLAERAQLTQGVVSRAEDQDYGNLTFNTVGRIAAGLDMAFIGRFVPFSELVKFSLNLSEEEFTTIPTFEEELNTVQPTVAATTFVKVAPTGGLLSIHALLAGSAPAQVVRSHEPVTILPRGSLFGIEALRSLVDIRVEPDYSGLPAMLFQPIENAQTDQGPIYFFMPVTQEQESGADA